MARTLIITALLPALVWLAGLHSTEAGVNEWTTHGPEGGDVSAFAIDPQTPTTLYAGTPGGGIFKSIDGGGGWRAVNNGLPAGSTDGRYVNVLAVDPQTPTTLFAGTCVGVFKSTDAGDPEPLVTR